MREPMLRGATVLLWLNEGVAVRTARSLDEAQAAAGALSDAPVVALVQVSELEDTAPTFSSSRTKTSACARTACS